MPSCSVVFPPQSSAKRTRCQEGITFTTGRVRQVVIVLYAPLSPEELVYVKGHFTEWDPAASPCPPPASDTWNAAEIGHGDAPDMLFVLDAPAEAPLAEEAVPAVRDLGVLEQNAAVNAEEPSHQSGGDSVVEEVPAAFRASRTPLCFRPAPANMPAWNGDPGARVYLSRWRPSRS